MINKFKNILARNLTNTFFVTGLGCVFISFFIYIYVDLNHGVTIFLKEFAKVLLQSAFIVLIAAAINELLRGINRRTAKVKSDRENRIEFLRRVRAVHTTIATSRTLLIAHKSPKSYVDVMRQLIQLGYDVIEIKEDLKVTVDLFKEKEKDNMNLALGHIDDFINEGVEEYKRCKKKVESRYDKNEEDNLTPVIRVEKMKWLEDLWNGEGTYKTIYGENITTLKKILRNYAYQEDYLLQNNNKN